MLRGAHIVGDKDSAKIECTSDDEREENNNYMQGQDGSDDNNIREYSPNSRSAIKHKNYPQISRLGKKVAASSSSGSTAKDGKRKRISSKATDTSGTPKQIVISDKNGLPQISSPPYHRNISNANVNSNVKKLTTAAPMLLMNNLPYMGELTFDTRPRRGRKPKKADICHLISKNYGIHFPPNNYLVNGNPVPSLISPTPASMTSQTGASRKNKKANFTGSTVKTSGNVTSLSSLLSLNHDTNMDSERRGNTIGAFSIEQLLPPELLPSSSHSGSSSTAIHSGGTKRASSSRVHPVLSIESLLASAPSMMIEGPTNDYDSNRKISSLQTPTFSLRKDTQDSKKRAVDQNEPLNLCVRDDQEVVEHVTCTPLFSPSFSSPQNETILTMLEEKRGKSSKNGDSGSPYSREYSRRGKGINVNNSRHAATPLTTTSCDVSLVKSDRLANSTYSGGYEPKSKSKRKSKSNQVDHNNTGAAVTAKNNLYEGGSLFGQASSSLGNGAEVSICKFKFTGGAKPSLQEKKMLSVDSGGKFRFYTDKTSSAAGKMMKTSDSGVGCNNGNTMNPTTADVQYGLDSLPRSAKSMSMCMPMAHEASSSKRAPPNPSVPAAREKRGGDKSPSFHSVDHPIINNGKKSAISSSEHKKSSRGKTGGASKGATQCNLVNEESKISTVASGSSNSFRNPVEPVPKVDDMVLSEQEQSSSADEMGDEGEGGMEMVLSRNRGSTEDGPSSMQLKKKRRTRKSLVREKLEKTFKEKGFLIQTQQLESAEGATYCKFRQLRKFTRYLFRSWKDYLPETVKAAATTSGSGGVPLAHTNEENQGRLNLSSFKFINFCL